MTDTLIINQTAKWIKSVVVDCNFCPFAAKALSQKSIHYTVMQTAGIENVLKILTEEFQRLDTNEHIETTFIIFPNNFEDFKVYLKLVNKAERILFKEGYEGVYQIASFHPDYCFEGAPADDAANYTNRSVYPMLHLLREDSVTKALTYFKDPESIPERNIDFARQKGLQYMQMLRTSCI